MAVRMAMDCWRRRWIEPILLVAPTCGWATKKPLDAAQGFDDLHRRPAQAKIDATAQFDVGANSHGAKKQR
jgi:hypothetical protein